MVVARPTPAGIPILTAAEKRGVIANQASMAVDEGQLDDQSHA